MNFMECNLGGASGNTVLEHSAFSHSLTNEQSQSLLHSGAEQAVTLGIRPDDVSISTMQTEKHSIVGEVLVTELLGGDMLVEAQIDGSRVTVKTDPGYEADMGDKCYLAFDSTRWHLFDNNTGSTLF